MKQPGICNNMLLVFVIHQNFMLNVFPPRILFIAYYEGFWVYPILQVLAMHQRVIFISVCISFFASFYILGESLTKFIWRKLFMLSLFFFSDSSIDAYICCVRYILATQQEITFYMKSFAKVKIFIFVLFSPFLKREDFLFGVI